MCIKEGEGVDRERRKEVDFFVSLSPAYTPVPEEAQRREKEEERHAHVILRGREKEKRNKYICRGGAKKEDVHDTEGVQTAMTCMCAIGRGRRGRCGRGAEKEDPQLRRRGGAEGVQRKMNGRRGAAKEAEGV